MVSHCKSRLIKPMFTIGISMVCAAAFSEETTLCHDFEEIYFSCHVGRKIISVCAVGNISPINGYVKYRFGDMNKVELNYPHGPYTPERHFSIAEVNEGSYKLTHLRFRSGAYNYVIYDGPSSGLYIKKGGKMILNLICESGDYSWLSPRVFHGIPSMPPGDVDYR